MQSLTDEPYKESSRANEIFPLINVKAKIGYSENNTPAAIDEKNEKEKWQKETIKRTSLEYGSSL